MNAGIQVRERHTKHWAPAFKKLRRLKVNFEYLAACIQSFDMQVFQIGSKSEAAKFS